MTDPPESTPAERHEEIELKYRVGDLAAGERLLEVASWESLGATGGRVRETRMEDRYVDTSAGDLERAGYAVRLRRGPNGTIVSAKSLARTVAPDGAVLKTSAADPKLRRGYAERGLALARERFHIASVADAWQAVYSQLVENR